MSKSSSTEDKLIFDWVHHYITYNQHKAHCRDLYDGDHPLLTSVKNRSDLFRIGMWVGWESEQASVRQKLERILELEAENKELREQLQVFKDAQEVLNRHRVD